jgi:rod shape-determining protein MreC
MIAFRNADSSNRVTALFTRSVLFSLFALGLIILDRRYDQLTQVRQWLSVVAYPLEVAVASPFKGWAWFRESVSTRGSLRAENDALNTELKAARFRLQRLDALEVENARLRALRNSTAGLGARFVIGDVVNVDLDAFRQRVLVDKGARSGLYSGQPVLDARGVFGQVTRVGQLTSEVIMISDLAHAIPVQVNRNGLRTIAVGTGESTRLKLPYLSTSADIVKGDLLVTSGLGGHFPSGYPVGVVSDIKRDPAQSLADVSVTPAASLDRSHEIMFVWTPAEQPLAQSAPPSLPAAPPAAIPSAAPSRPPPASASPPPGVEQTE